MDFKKTIRDHLAVIEALAAEESTVIRIAGRLSACLESGGKICWMGNGGSAADSQHLAAELVGRYERERPGIASIALTTDTSILTAVANDYEYDHVFSRQIEALCTNSDAVIGISTSGSSPNVIRGILAARERGAYTVGLSGRDGGELARCADDCITVSSGNTARIQEAHALLGHVLCEWIEAASVDAG